MVAGASGGLAETIINQREGNFAMCEIIECVCAWVLVPVALEIADALVYAENALKIEQESEAAK